jgi:hypothetical protein
MSKAGVHSMHLGHTQCCSLSDEPWVCLASPFEVWTPNWSVTFGWAIEFHQAIFYGTSLLCLPAAAEAAE